MKRTLPLLLTAVLVSLPPAVADIPRGRGPDSEPSSERASEWPIRREVDIPRGQLLYENHCRECHESVVHVRERRSARTLAALESAVRRWAMAASLAWGEDEIVEVVEFLNARYYRLER